MIKSNLEDEGLSPFMTVISLVNGMVGGFILILPIFALETGYISTLIVILVTGFFSYFSCQVTLPHIGQQPDLDSTIFKHFGQSKFMKNLYDFSVWLSLMLIGLLYFQLIIIQWIGIAPPHHYSITNVLLNALVLFVVTFAMKYYDFGANLMAYGIISIISYLIFLAWVVGSEDKETKTKQFKAFGNGFIELAAGMGQAFAIQGFFVPVLRKSTSKNHKKMVLIAYIIGVLAYFYIAFMGSYGIMYREYLSFTEGQKTIQGYFGVGTWQVSIIEIIYLLHLYSVFPQFMLIGKKRLFGILDYQNTCKKQINVHQILYICFAIGICLILALLKVSIRQIIDFNGAVIGSMFIYFFPAIMHIKCLYFSKGKIPVQQKELASEKYQQMIQQNVIQLEKKNKNTLEQNNTDRDQQKIDNDTNKDSKKQFEQNVQPEIKNRQILDNQSKNQSYQCNCSLQSYSPREKLGNIVLLGMMIALGVFVLVDGLIQLTNMKNDS